LLVSVPDVAEAGLTEPDVAPVNVIVSETLFEPFPMLSVYVHGVADGVMLSRVESVTLRDTYDPVGPPFQHFKVPPIVGTAAAAPDPTEAATVSV
jgi:hypothetical protein